MELLKTLQLVAVDANKAGLIVNSERIMKLQQAIDEAQRKDRPRGIVAPKPEPKRANIDDEEPEELEKRLQQEQVEQYDRSIKPRIG